MGLGPHGISLLDRVGKALVAIDNDSEPFQMMIEQQNRTDARMIARMQFLAKHKKAQKPLAPVEQSSIKTSEGKRCWVWIGEDIPSKGLEKAGFYTSETIRKAGFKLPKLEKKEKK